MSFISWDSNDDMTMAKKKPKAALQSRFHRPVRPACTSAVYVYPLHGARHALLNFVNNKAGCFFFKSDSIDKLT